MDSVKEPELWYPTVDDVLLIHEDVIAEDDAASPGVHDPEKIEFALEYVEEGHFGHVPESIHEKAFHLIRLIASNHWFVDGNKRTALNTTELFYLVNGYELDYGEDIRSMLKLISVRESLIDRDEGPRYLADQTTPPQSESDQRIGAVLVLVAVALAELWDVDIDDSLPEGTDRASIRDVWGLTTGYDGTINPDDIEDER